MGYTTDFSGEFEIIPPLTPEQVAYLKAFNNSRRMRRDAEKTGNRPDPLRIAVGLKTVGPEGAYFVNESGFAGQDHGPDVLDGNNPPKGQPGLWCQWVPTDDGEALVWDEAEKFYAYVNWLKYLASHFLHPWGRALSGSVTWQGEESSDMGRIVCTQAGAGETAIVIQHAVIRYEDAE